MTRGGTGLFRNPDDFPYFIERTLDGCLDFPLRDGNLKFKSAIL